MPHRTDRTDGRAVCFGEVMLRLSPPGYLRLGQSQSLEMTFGGAEANVAVALAQLGQAASFVTKLPDTPITQAFYAQMRSFGVDVSQAVSGGERMGIYFVEKGASMRPSQVVYDRKHSSITRLTPGEIDWDAVLEGAGWFHVTGITPALSEDAARETLESMRAAKRLGLTVSCDLNFRRNLWTQEQARPVMTQMMAYTDLLIGNGGSALDVFGISVGADPFATDPEHAQALSKRLYEAFGCNKIALTVRESLSASDNNCSGSLYDGASGRLCQAPWYAIRIVDRIGGGDAFDAGLIFALMRGDSDQQAVDLASAASALKHTVEGDFSRMSLAEVEALMAGDSSGRVRR